LFVSEGANTSELID